MESRNNITDVCMFQFAGVYIIVKTPKKEPGLVFFTKNLKIFELNY